MSLFVSQQEKWERHSKLLPAFGKEKLGSRRENLRQNVHSVELIRQPGGANIGGLDDATRAGNVGGDCRPNAARNVVAAPQIVTLAFDGREANHKIVTLWDD